ncbi:MAG: TonB-dependent receptor [Nitrospiraceae bacterium]|nr:TonB-dependent receptor [Nitrospiraceae bacterium]
MGKKCFFAAASALILCLFIFPGARFSYAAEGSNDQPDTSKMSPAELTKAELLLFWDEKDLYVQSATRSQKSISQVAENMTVVTAKEIEDMNAHTVAEVLNRVTDVFVDFGTTDFGSSSILHIQGSEGRHVLVLVDGVTWNFLNEGSAETNTIPVRIIDRIEIIKGPASSSWGSSLGGVVNIITKNAGSSPVPSGTLSGSIGERGTQDYNGEVSGKAGPLGYYLFAGKQRSDGLRDNRDFESYSLYSKLRFDISRDVNVGLTAGYSEPHEKFLDSVDFDLSSKGVARTLFVTGSVDAVISPELSLQAMFYTFKNRFVQLNDFLSTGEPFLHIIFDEETTAGSGKLVWKHGIATGVIGLDFSHGSLDQNFDGIYMLNANPSIDKWAVYANDTISLGDFTVTPGVRFDHNNVTGSFTSPSLGVTYKLAEKTILRGSVSRGFTIPPLSWTSGGGLFTDPNPGLAQESVWSYQVGVESNLTDFLWTKATIFRYDLSDSIGKGSLPSGNVIYVNDGNVKRQGVEVEAETVPFYNVSLKAGFAYIHKRASEETDPTVNYACNIGIKYDDRKGLMAQLFGHYAWWDLAEDSGAKYDTFIWDMNVRKSLFSSEKVNAEIFATAHNIFNGSYYTSGLEKNPRRWLEAGLRVKF